MYERSYGYKYDEAKGSATDIAKMIRADIKQAVAEGLLPSRWRYSVKTRYASIDVEVKNCADAWIECDGSMPGTRHVWPDGSSTATRCPNVWCKARNDPQYAHAAETHDVLTDEAQVAKITLERIHNAYNHDGSETQVDYFDVRYYGSVDFQTARGADFEQREKARKAARKATR